GPRARRSSQRAHESPARHRPPTPALQDPYGGHKQFLRRRLVAAALMADGSCADGRWQMADGGWRTADGGWQMADCGWQRAEDGAGVAISEAAIRRSPPSAIRHLPSAIGSPAWPVPC